MRKPRAARTHPTIEYLNNLEALVVQAKVETWRANLVTEAEIARERPAIETQVHAIFDQWRAETRARLGMGAS